MTMKRKAALILAVALMLTAFPLTALSARFDDSAGAAESLKLPLDRLDLIGDTETVAGVVFAAAVGMDDAQRNSTAGIDLLTLFAEEAITRAATSMTDGNIIVIDYDSVEALQRTAIVAKSAAEEALLGSGITLRREIRCEVRFKTGTGGTLSVAVDPSAVEATADSVRVETPDYAVAFSSEAIKANSTDALLNMSVSEFSNAAEPTEASIENAPAAGRMDAAPFANRTTGAYVITFNKPVSEKIKLSLAPIDGEPQYQAIFDGKGEAVGGKYNPATNKLDAKISESGAYAVADNPKDFADISLKPAQMQEAITVLASKGIINGKNSTEFDPDSAITRAEIAAIIIRALARLDNDADGGFDDVCSEDWFCGAVGSAKRHGIVNGTSGTTFSPQRTIRKDQIIAIAARVLRAEMKYSDAANMYAILSSYTDATAIAPWGLADIALATREGLVEQRDDGAFDGAAAMTRGDAAVVVYRLYLKLW
ncbi:MAG: S-layer homology domain-containing protein [Oscillospiraceae bacterium]|nr:S-layer homology domain-containing protein [Oscillospiraceae bacterium]